MSLNSTAGDAAADSYFAITDANTYFSGRGTAWDTASTSQKENAARAGTKYLDNQYRSRWIGLRMTQNQALAWPRTDGSRIPWRQSVTYPLVDLDGFQIDQTTVPLQVQRAAMEAALLSLTGTDLQPVLIRGNAIKSTVEQVGPIREETVYADSAPVIDHYTVIEGLLRGLVNSTPGASTGTVGLVRA